MGMRWIVGVVSAVVFCFGVARADELEDMKRAMDEMKREMAKSMEKMQAEIQAEREAMRAEREAMRGEREAMRAERETILSERDSILAAAGGEPEALLGRNNKDAKIQIGGIIASGYQFSRQSRTDNPHIMDHNQGNWYWKDLALTFGIQMSELVSGHINLNLDLPNYGAQTDSSGLNQLIEEAYITWKDIAKTGIEAQVGKQVLPFGSYYGGAVASDPYTKHGGTTWQGQTRGTFGQYDNRTALKLSYAMPKMWDALLEAAVFQNVLPGTDAEVGGVGVTASQANNMTNWGDPGPVFPVNVVPGDGRQDDYGFQSFATRLTVHPIERLMVQTSFMSQHNEAMGRYDFNTDPVVWNDLNADDVVDPGELNGITEGGAEWIVNGNGAKDVYAMSFAAKYDFKAPFSVFGEYVATWNLGNIRGMQSDIVSAGIDWRPKQFNDKLTLTLLGDYEYISGIDDEDFVFDNNGNYVVRNGGVGMSTGNDSRGNTVRWVNIEEEHLTRVILAGRYEMKNGLFFGGEVGHEWWYREGSYIHNPNFDNVSGNVGETVRKEKDQQLDATRFAVYMGIAF